MIPGAGDRGPPCAVRLTSAAHGFILGGRVVLLREDERRAPTMSSELSSEYSPLSLTTEPNMSAGSEVGYTAPAE